MGSIITPLTISPAQSVCSNEMPSLCSVPITKNWLQYFSSDQFEFSKTLGGKGKGEEKDGVGSKKLGERGRQGMKNNGGGNMER